jgi:tetratricopeptide (TPR) repeat protein
VTLANRVILLRWGVWVALVAAALVVATELRASPAYWLVLPVVALTWLASRRAATLVVRGAYRRLARLVDEGQYDAAHALVRELRTMYLGSATGLEHVRMSEATILALEARHAEASSLLESLDRKAFQGAWLAWLLNNLAWSLAHTEQGARAVAVARESMDTSAAGGDRTVSVEDLRACQLGTLGASLVVAGSAEEALPLLEQALARGGRPRQQTARAFFQGEALHALGRGEEAASAWRRAVETAPETEHGRRALARLDAMRAYR